jgi:hypothetical protein
MSHGLRSSYAQIVLAWRIHVHNPMQRQTYWLTQGSHPAVRLIKRQSWEQYMYINARCTRQQWPINARPPVNSVVCKGLCRLL